MNIDKRQVIPFICFFVALLVVSMSITVVVVHHNKVTRPVVINVLEIASTDFKTPQSGIIMSRETFEAMQESGLNTVYNTYESYLAAQQNMASMQTVTSNITASGANALLYQIADKNFNVYYGSMRVSPIIVMAISNVETPGRADFSVTWSALFPSRIVSVDRIQDFNVTDVLSSEEVYTALSTEYSTRDRGALQMSPSYGTGNPAVNALMSGTEKDKLSLIDTSAHKTWVSGASDKPGDRFYLPDVCLRLSAAFQSQTLYMQQNDYQPMTDLQLIGMLAASHQSSGVWYWNNHSKSVGCWRSGELAYEYCQMVSSKSMIDKLTEYAKTSTATYIDSKTAQRLYNELGYEPMSKYSTKDIVCLYVIKALYAYIKLCMLYTA